MPTCRMKGSSFFSLLLHLESSWCEMMREKAENVHVSLFSTKLLALSKKSKRKTIRAIFVSSFVDLVWKVCSEMSTQRILCHGAPPSRTESLLRKSNSITFYTNQMNSAPQHRCATDFLGLVWSLFAASHTDPSPR
jgi:hypothetical protein